MRKSLIAHFVGAEELDALWIDSPLAYYMAHIMLSAWLWLGATVLLAASQPEKYRVLVDITIAGLLVMGITCGLAGWVDGMPVWWHVGDAVACLVPVILLAALRFVPHAKTGGTSHAIPAA